MRPGLINRLWRASTWPEARRFERAARRVAETQRALLTRYLAVNAATVFGREHAFGRLSTVTDYQSAVPVRRYDDFTDAVQRIGRGEERVLTVDPVRLLQPSSGSAGPAKLVPVTDELQSEFRRGVSTWIADLFGQWPQLMDGPAYWSVTPMIEGRMHTPSGIGVGFDADSAYLGRTGRLLESHVLAVPDAVKSITDMEAFRYVTLRFLLAAADLRLVSIWNPTYLTLLLDALPDYWDALLADVATGRLSLPSGLGDERLAAITRSLRPDPARAADLAEVGPCDPRAVWPRVDLISCWADGPAAAPAAALADRWPSARLQPKGLIATEAFVTLPLVEAPGGVLAVRSHFFEFLPSGGGPPRLAHELAPNCEYDVVVTTGGGLYRYLLGDRVRVTGHWGDVPCLRFTSRADRVSDWFGEKLSETFVDRVVRDLMAANELAPVFAVLAPDDSVPEFRYTLYIDVPGTTVSRHRLSALATDLDERLSTGFHYDWCRRLGQLGPAHVVLVRDGAQTYLTVCRARGQRLGEVKPGSLLPTTGWGEWLTPAGDVEYDG